MSLFITLQSQFGQYAEKISVILKLFFFTTVTALLIIRFKPRIAVLWNPGKLLEGITIDDLKINYQTILRNELICNAFLQSKPDIKLRQRNRRIYQKLHVGWIAQARIQGIIRRF